MFELTNGVGWSSRSVAATAKLPAASPTIVGTEKSKIVEQSLLDLATGNGSRQ